MVVTALGCTGHDAPAIDGRALDAALVDAAVVDAAEVDAAEVDAALPDGTMLDAALPDGTMLDAALPDAAPDAAPPDSAPDAPPIDGAVTDAEIDAPPVVDPLGFPQASPASLVVDAAGELLRAMPGATQVAWVDIDTTLQDVTAWYAYLDAQVAMPLPEYPDAVTVGPGDVGHALVAVPASVSPPLGGVSDVAVGAGTRRLAVPGIVDIVDARAAGTVVVEGAGGGYALLRIAASFTLDPSFGSAGRVALPGPVGLRVAQPLGASSVITLVAAGRLHRIDLTTGAAIASFGGTGDIALGLAPAATLLALAPLPGGALTLVVRPTSTAMSIDLIQIDATGARAPAISVDLPLLPVAAGADATGRVVVAFDLAAGTQRLMRLDAATGQVDLGFGVAGKAHVAAPLPPPSGGWTLQPQSLRFLGVQGDGRIVLSRNYRYYPPGSCGALPVTCWLPHARLYRLD